MEVNGWESDQLDFLRPDLKVDFETKTKSLSSKIQILLPKDC